VVKRFLKIAIAVCPLTIIKMELYSQSPLEEGGNSVIQFTDNHSILVSPHDQTVLRQFVGSTIFIHGPALDSFIENESAGRPTENGISKPNLAMARHRLY